MTSFKIIIGLLFGFLATGISILMVAVYDRNKDSNETAARIQRTEEVLDYTDELSSLYKNLQLEIIRPAQEGDTLNSIYYESRNKISSSISRLSQLTKENESQQTKIDSLEKTLSQLIRFSDSVINSRSKTLAELQHVIQRNLVFRVQARRLIRSIKADEIKLLEIRKAANAKSEEAFNNSFTLMVSSIGALLIAIFFTIRHNFNKRMQIQEELRGANEMFGKLFHESPVAIVISDIETGEIIDCNKAYCELLHLRAHEIIGHTGIGLGIIKPEQRQLIKEAATSHDNNYDLDIVLYAERSTVPIPVSVSVEKIQVRNKMCLLSVVLDMTSHKKAEEDIKYALAKEVELNKMKSNFVTLASHEFRTPLTTILSSVFLLEKYSTGENQENITKHLKRIKSSVNTLTAILEEFLSLNKMEEGKIKPTLEQVNIAECLDKTCKNLSGFAKSGQQIIYSHSGENHIMTDPVIMKNIINNLVSNAIKYSPENSPIYVTSHVNQYLKLSIKDSGIGISAQDQKHLFTRFYRGSNAGNVQGTGLGLHIMKNYVQMLNGSIDLKSELGKGTEFTITFDTTPVINS
jgi:PAS domain S-box-containing protein